MTNYPDPGQQPVGHPQPGQQDFSPPGQQYQPQAGSPKPGRNQQILAAVLGVVALLVVGGLGVLIGQTLGNKANDTSNAGSQTSNVQSPENNSQQQGDAPVQQSQNPVAPATQEVPVGAQLTPPNATSQGGIKLLSTGTQPAAGVPHVVIYEDYQCPACGAREQSYGPAIDQLIDEGKITVEITTAYFLDQAKHNQSSRKAALAAAAADQVGKYRQYHKVIYLNQQASNAAGGFTDQQLRVDFAAQAGITGEDLVKFQKLYDERAFQNFTAKADARLELDGVSSTPTFLIKGKPLQFVDQAAQKLLIQPTAADLLRAITEANK